MGLRAHGWNTVREAVRSNIELARALEDRLRESGFRVLEGGQLSVSCARWEPRDWEGPALDDLQAEIAADVVSSGKAWFATVEHAGERWLRFNIVNLTTTTDHVDAMAQLVIEAARRASLS